MKTPTKQERRLEVTACEALSPDRGNFNQRCQLPYGLKTIDVQLAMTAWSEFLAFVNLRLYERGTPRLETMLMPANFSSMVGEFMTSNIPKFCRKLVKNTYHNGHPDMLPAGQFAEDAAQHATEGIEVKASRYLRGWQGHNPEDVWLMVFSFESGRPNDEQKKLAPRPFRFLQVACARLEMSDWLFAGRTGTSRRTITASVTPSGHAKMMRNWIYKVPDLVEDSSASLEE